jgi:hypothetical protein
LTISVYQSFQFLYFYFPVTASSSDAEMLGQLDMARHPEVGLGLLLATVVLMETVIVPAATPVDIALVPLMTADGIGIPLVVVFVDLQAGKYFPWSLQP